MYYKISIPRWQIYCFSLLLTPPNSYSWIAWCLLFSFLYMYSHYTSLTVYANWGVTLKMYNFSLIWDCFKWNEIGLVFSLSKFSKSVLTYNKTRKREEHHQSHNTIQLESTNKRVVLLIVQISGENWNAQQASIPRRRVSRWPCVATWAEVEVLCWLCVPALFPSWKWKQASLYFMCCSAC